MKDTILLIEDEKIMRITLRTPSASDMKSCADKWFCLQAIKDNFDGRDDVRLLISTGSILCRNK
jgi:hypothetical protein